MNSRERGRRQAGASLRWALCLACAAVAGQGLILSVWAASGPAQPDAAAVMAAIQDWPKPSQDAAQEMMGKYGPPAEATATMLTWQANGLWKRTIVSKTPVEHDFPIKHMDVLEQVVEYRMPLNFFEAVATFNGSVVPSRTRGELAAEGDREATNILALNLSDDIVQGRKTADQAREAMVSAARELEAGRMPDDAKELRISRPQGDLRDPDTAVAAPSGGALGPAVIR